MVSTKVRFEIFKRDLFTCQYCGRSSPEVELQVDHMIPQAKGGTDDIDNLITACSECNYAKNDTELSDWLYPIHKFDEQTQALKDVQKRKEQFNLFITYRRELGDLEKMEVSEISLLSNKIIKELDNRYFLKIRNLIKKYGFINVYRAMEKCRFLFIEDVEDCYKPLEIEFLPEMCEALFENDKACDNIEVYIIIKMIENNLLDGYLREVYNPKVEMFQKLFDVLDKKYYPETKTDTRFIQVFCDIYYICTNTQFSKELRYKNIFDYLKTGEYEMMPF